MTGTVLTVSIWHNVTRDADGRPTGYDGYRAGHEMVRVFAYDIPADGRDLAGTAEDAHAIGNAAPGLTGQAADLAARYAQRQLRSLSFPGKRPCSARECCLHRGPVLSGSPWILLAGETGAVGYGQPGMRVRLAAPPR